jgi:hypothetical protein
VEKMRKSIEFACKVAGGKVTVYIDLDDETVFSEVYNNEFSSLNIRKFRKKLSEVSTREILAYFEEIIERYGKQEFLVRYDLLTVRVKDFEDFTNSIWFAVMRAKKQKKSQARN